MDHCQRQQGSQAKWHEAILMLTKSQSHGHAYMNNPPNVPAIAFTTQCTVRTFMYNYLHTAHVHITCTMKIVQDSIFTPSAHLIVRLRIKRSNSKVSVILHQPWVRSEANKENSKIAYDNMYCIYTCMYMCLGYIICTCTTSIRY